MTVPGIVQSAIGGEEFTARVSIGGDDELFVTPSSTVLYRSEGLLSDEAIEEYDHDADRLTVSEGRRKTTVTLEYAVDGPREFTIPSDVTAEALRPILGGVLNGNDITDEAESVVELYRFSELTLIVTGDRLVKHVGEAVWDEDYEEYHYGDVTNLSFEDGSVATQIVLTVDGRPQRIKAPNDQADDLRERLETALFEYHGVDSLAELNETLGPDEDDADEREAVDFGDSVDPLETESAAEEETEPEASEEPRSDSTAGAESPQQAADADDAAAAESTPILEEPSTAADAGTAAAAADQSSDGATTDPELLERIDDLEDAVESQRQTIEDQQETIEQLIEELRRGR